MDYSIYKIVSKNPLITDLYIGSTNNFNSRKTSHKKKVGENTTIKLYQFINNNGGWENFKMELIEQINCNDRNEATQKERFWCNQLNATLNTRIPSRTKKQYYQDYRERIIKRVTDNTNKNKEKYDAYAKQYREAHKNKVNCSCGGCYTLINRTTHLKSSKHIKFIESINNEIKKLETQE